MKGKLRDRWTQAIFVGYVDYHAGNVHRFVNMKTKKIIQSRDVTWRSKLYDDIYKQNNIVTTGNWEHMLRPFSKIQLMKMNQKNLEDLYWHLKQ